MERKCSSEPEPYWMPKLPAVPYSQVLPQVILLPVGGVNLTNADELFACGAFALGVGSDLVDRKLIMNGEYSKISSIAQKYTDIANKYVE